MNYINAIDLKNKALLKPNKLKAKRIKIDNIWFDSTVEGHYYIFLKSELKYKKIKGFILQPEYILQDKFKSNGETIRAIKYKSDFLVTHNDDNEIIIDIKGHPTPDALLKRKLFLKKYPEKTLQWLTYVVKYGGWIDYWELKKILKKNKNAILKNRKRLLSSKK